MNCQPIFVVKTIMPLLLLMLVPSLTFAAPFNLPDTGQTICYNSSGVELPCAGTGQDGAYTINPMRFTDNGDGTVTDNNTGLVWQKEDDVTTRTWDDATAYCLGHTNWRLPSKKELISIVDYSIPYSPAYPNSMTINASYFPNTLYDYWSSTPSFSGTNAAWEVNFTYGLVFSWYGKSTNFYVRCVRGDQIQGPALDDNKDGTVTDTRTGLTWQQGEPGFMTWDSALSYCENLELPAGSGQSDWRLPNIKELESLTDDTRHNPSIDTTLFPGATEFYYWSSTNSAGIPVFAWVVLFSSGDIVNSGSKLDPSNYVRCVRGGQSGVYGNLSIVKSGTGTGTVRSTPSGLNCSAAYHYCSAAPFLLNTVVTLAAVPAADGSIFSGWSEGSGDCADGQVSMDTGKSCTASFTLCDPASTASITGSPPYDSIAAAYAGAAYAPDEVLIDIIASNQSELLDFSADKNIKLQGGCNCSFAPQPGINTIITSSGALTISNGTVEFANVIIQ